MLQGIVLSSFIHLSLYTYTYIWNFILHIYLKSIIAWPEGMCIFIFTRYCQIAHLDSFIRFYSAATYEFQFLSSPKLAIARLWHFSQFDSMLTYFTVVLICILIFRFINLLFCGVLFKNYLSWGQKYSLLFSSKRFLYFLSHQVFNLPGVDFYKWYEVGIYFSLMWVINCLKMVYWVICHFPHWSVSHFAMYQVAV